MTARILTAIIIGFLSVCSVADAPDPIREFIQTEQVEYRKNLECLADNIYHEARGEGQEGWSAVAHVTLNRVKSRKFPNNVCKVVRERNQKGCQFSWVCTNKGSSRTHRESKLYGEIKLFSSRFLQNNGIDFTRGALFYHASSINPWRFKKAKIRETARIGKHIFYK